MNDDGLCIDRSLEPKQFHCIAQQCAFDYCIWYRDQYIEACKYEIEEEKAKKAPRLPNWDDVYNYDELHGDYLLYYESGGVEGHTSDMCVAYYKMYDGAELRDELEDEDAEADEDGEDIDNDEMDGDDQDADEEADEDGEDDFDGDDGEDMGDEGEDD